MFNALKEKHPCGCAGEPDIVLDPVDSS